MFCSCKHGLHLSLHTSREAEPDKEKKENDMFEEIMQTSGSANSEQRAWRITLAENGHGHSQDKRKAQENVHDMQQEMIALLKEQSDILKNLVDLQAQQKEQTALLRSLIDLQVHHL